MKKVDILIKVILSISLLPASLIYIGIAIEAMGSVFTGQFLLYKIFFRDLLIFILPSGFGLYSVWWGIFNYSNIIFQQIPKYIWVYAMVGVFAVDMALIETDDHLLLPTIILFGIPVIIGIILVLLIRYRNKLFEILQTAIKQHEPWIYEPWI